MTYMNRRIRQIFYSKRNVLYSCNDPHKLYQNLSNFTWLWCDVALCMRVPSSPLLLIYDLIYIHFSFSYKNNWLELIAKSTWCMDLPFEQFLVMIWRHISCTAGWIKHVLFSFFILCVRHFENLLLSGSMETLPLFWKSLFSTDFFRISGG